jgi:hypothetical protein
MGLEFFFRELLIAFFTTTEETEVMFHRVNIDERNSHERKRRTREKRCPEGISSRHQEDMREARVCQVRRCGFMRASERR